MLKVISKDSEFLHAGYTPLYHPLQYGVAFCKLEKDSKGKNILRQLTRFRECRGYAVEEMVACALNENYNSNSTYPITKETKLVYDKARLLLKGPKIENLRKGLFLLNLLEKEVGWLQSRFYGIEHPNYEKGTVLYLVGSKNWLSAPPYTSLYLLILRLLHHYPIEEKESAEGYFKRVSLINKTSLGATSKYDTTYMKNILSFHKNTIFTLMKNRKRILGSKVYVTEKPGWANSTFGRLCHQVGITELLKVSTEVAKGRNVDPPGHLSKHWYVNLAKVVKDEKTS